MHLRPGLNVVMDKLEQSGPRTPCLYVLLKVPKITSPWLLNEMGNEILGLNLKLCHVSDENMEES